MLGGTLARLPPRRRQQPARQRRPWVQVTAAPLRGPDLPPPPSSGERPSTRSADRRRTPRRNPAASRPTTTANTSFLPSVRIWSPTHRRQARIAASASEVSAASESTGRPQPATTAATACRAAPRPRPRPGTPRTARPPRAPRTAGTAGPGGLLGNLRLRPGTLPGRRAGGFGLVGRPAAPFVSGQVRRHGLAQPVLHRLPTCQRIDLGQLGPYLVCDAGVAPTAVGAQFDAPLAGGASGHQGAFVAAGVGVRVTVVAVLDDQDRCSWCGGTAWYLRGSGGAPPRDPKRGASPNRDGGEGCRGRGRPAPEVGGARRQYQPTVGMVDPSRYIFVTQVPSSSARPRTPKRPAMLSGFRRRISPR